MLLTAAQAPAASPEAGGEGLLFGTPSAEEVEDGAADAPASPVAREYDEAIRSNAQTADRMQGPLDGAWLLRDAGGGADLYRFQLSDPDPRAHPPEGAWRDLTAKPGPGSAGLVDAILPTGPGGMMFRFEARPGDLVVVTLTLAGRGLWRGELWRNGRTQPVVLVEEG